MIIIYHTILIIMMQLMLHLLHYSFDKWCCIYAKHVPGPTILGQQRPPKSPLKEQTMENNPRQRLDCAGATFVSLWRRSRSSNTAWMLPRLRLLLPLIEFDACGKLRYGCGCSCKAKNSEINNIAMIANNKAIWQL